MQKRVFIIHGWDGYPEEGWFPWLKRELEVKGFHVEVPAMPNPEKPEIESWLRKLKDQIKEINQDTYFVGHSIGCQAILRFLETLEPNVKIGGAIFIAPWMHLDKNTIREEGKESEEIAKPWMETPINWNKVKIHTNDFICIFSDNDSYVPLSDKDIFKEKLSAKTIIEHEKGHFSGDDNIIELPSALDSLLEISE